MPADAVPADDVTPDDDTVTLLDGGLATELESRGHDLRDPLWSARLLHENPEAVRDAHAAFFRAGAQVATTASYQAGFEGFAARGLSRPESAALLRSSVRLAREAAEVVDAEWPDPVPRQVAASVGPYGAQRADGSEYSGDYGVTDAFLREVHRPRLEVLATAGADLLAIETIPSEQEATVLMELLAELPSETRAWLALTCASAVSTRRGEDVRRVFSLARGEQRIVAVGVNCTAPEHVGPLVETAVAASGKPAVVYPNSGERWDARTRSWSGDSRGIDVGAVPGWVSAGARYVGGCCRVGVPDIAALHEALRGM